MSRPATEWASVEQTIVTPASRARRTFSAAEVEPGREPVDLEGDAGLQRRLERPLEVERVLGPVAEQTSGRMAEAADGGMVHRVRHPRRELGARGPLPGMERELHPLEAREHVVRQVETPVGTDVALAAAQHPKRREPLVRGRDLFRLAAQVVRVEAGDDPDAARVVADRDVLVAAGAGRLGQLEHGRPPVRPDGVAVQVAQDLVEPRRASAAPSGRWVAQLRGQVRATEPPVERGLVGCFRQRFQRGDVLGRTGRAEQGGPEGGRRRDDELDRRPVDRDADLLVEQADDLRQCARTGP